MNFYPKNDLQYILMSLYVRMYNMYAGADLGVVKWVA